MSIPYVGVVDDNEALCLSLVDLVRSVGYRAEPFHRAESLLEYSDRSNFDCIIVDVCMPGMGGIGLIRHLEAEKSEIPIIVITASPFGKAALSTGPFQFLRKPFNAGEFLECIERSLRG
jgi:FixJ family two-component response regulator